MEDKFNESNKNQDKKETKKTIKIPQTKETVAANCVLLAGLVLLILGLTIFLENLFINREIKILSCVINLAAGEICLFICFGFFKLPSLIFLGTFFIFNGILAFFSESPFFGLSFGKLWPFIIINTGLSLFPYQIAKFKKLKSNYLFPALLFITLGILFLLFSMKIIPVSFTNFIKTWWPLVFVFMGIMLIVTFIMLKSGKNREKLNQYVDFDGDNL